METIKEVLEETPSNSKNSREVFGVKYFYEKFSIKHHPQMFEKTKNVRPRKIPISLYKQILIQYFDIYFKEIYFFSGPSYFLYTGSLEKVRYSQKVLRNYKGSFIKKPTIGFMWYLRPSELFYFCCKIKKMIGSTNRIPKIEKLFKNSNDIELIVNFDDAIRANNLRKNNFLR